jgi:hypothetical protein
MVFRTASVKMARHHAFCRYGSFSVYEFGPGGGPRVPADPIDVGYDLVDLVLMPASGAAVGAPQARPPSLPPVRFQYAS